MASRRLVRCAIGAGVLVGIAQAAAAAETIERMAWLAGCWSHEERGTVSEEQWMAPRGGTMLGMSRTVSKGRTVAFEQLRIEEQGGKLVYIASPSGQSTASFAQTELGDGFVAFADPKHDFPQRIRYRLQDGGSLLAQIEGQQGGKAKVIEFPMSRVPCIIDR
jgi:hypothetical protein